MNQDQKQRILTQLEPFWKLDIDKRLAEAFKEHTDLASVTIGNFTASELSYYSKKVVKQLGEILETPYSNIIPFQYQFQNDFGSGNLADDLTNMNSFIESGSFTDLITPLYRLVYYQVSNGFWDKEVKNEDKKSFNQIIELESKLNLISENLLNNIESNKKLLESLKSEKESLELLVSTKKKELVEVESLLPAARNNSGEISKLLNSSTATNESINGILTQQESKLLDISKKIDEEKKAFTLFQAELKELIEQYNSEIKTSIKKNSEFESLLSTINEKSATFEDRIAVLNELIGKEGAVKLFNTFNDRKKDLEAPVKRWACIVICLGILALILIIGIFTNFFGLIKSMPMPTLIDWQFLVVNTLKSTPIMVVLFFAIKQYIRERTFQEEYAFRSAIALTIQAYGDISGTKKEELIFQAVSTIYSLPSMMKKRSSDFLGFRGKGLTDSINAINETLKNKNN